MSPASPRRDVGTCPVCEATLPASRVLFEYETGDGPATLAACPDCSSVVHPN